MQKNKIIIIGTGEQSKVTIDNIEEQSKYEIFGLIDSDESNQVNSKIYGYNVVCTDSNIEKLINENKDIIGYILGVGIGIDGSLKIRDKLIKKLIILLNQLT